MILFEVNEGNWILNKCVTFLLVIYSIQIFTKNLIFSEISNILKYPIYL